MLFFNIILVGYALIDYPSMIRDWKGEWYVVVSFLEINFICILLNLYQFKKIQIVAMFDEKVILAEQLPVRQKERKVTDCCCTVVGTVFALTMFIVACVLWNRGNFEQLYNTKTGPDYKPCAADEFLNVKNATDFQSRECVKFCPTGFQVYNDQICLPQDDKLKDTYLTNSKITRSFDNNGFKQTLFFTLIIAVGMGLIIMTINHCLPRIVPILTFVLAVLMLLFFAVMTFATSIVSALLGGFWAIVFGVLLSLLALILTVMLCMYSNEIKFQGFMLEYAVKFLNQNPHAFAYIPVFFLFHLGLVSLILWQHSCFSSYYMGSGNFWKLTSSGIFDILNIIEYLWGLQFLKDAYNFCVSGNAVDWYWTRHSSCYQPYQRLICKNWGSVVGGSFLNAFFEVPTLLVQLLVCHPTTCCSKLGTVCYNSCNIFTCFFELIRTDAYSYINLTGIPFCDAARQCGRLCDRSNQFVGYYSAMKHYRLATHISCISLVFFWGFWILDYRTFNFDLWKVAVLIMAIYGTVTWFIGIHIDASEGLQTSYLAELQLEGEHQYMQKILPSVRKVLQPLQNRVQGDGNC